MFQREGWLTQGPGRVVTVISKTNKQNSRKSNQSFVHVHYLIKSLSIKIDYML